MEQRSRIEKQPEGRAKPTGKAEKVGLGPWYREYTYQVQTDDRRELHRDPRSEQSHGQHQDSDLISSDGDPESFHLASGIGATLDHYTSDSSASDQGTLAGDLTDAYRRTTPQYMERDYPGYVGYTWSRIHTAGILHRPGTNRKPLTDNCRGWQSSRGWLR